MSFGKNFRIFALLVLFLFAGNVAAQGLDFDGDGSSDILAVKSENGVHSFRAYNAVSGVPVTEEYLISQDLGEILAPNYWLRGDKPDIAAIKITRRQEVELTLIDLSIKDIVSKVNLGRIGKKGTIITGMYENRPAIFLIQPNGDAYITLNPGVSGTYSFQTRFPKFNEIAPNVTDGKITGFTSFFKRKARVKSRRKRKKVTYTQLDSVDIFGLPIHSQSQQLDIIGQPILFNSGLLLAPGQVGTSRRSKKKFQVLDPVGNMLSEFKLGQKFSGVAVGNFIGSHSSIGTEQILVGTPSGKYKILDILSSTLFEGDVSIESANASGGSSWEQILEQLRRELERRLSQGGGSFSSGTLTFGSNSNSGSVSFLSYPSVYRISGGKVLSLVADSGNGPCDKMLKAPDGSGGFLAKNGIYTGKIVILTLARKFYQNGRILNSDNFSVIEKLRYDGIKNGNRAHFRGNKAVYYYENTVFAADIRVGNKKQTHCWPLGEGVRYGRLD